MYLVSLGDNVFSITANVNIFSITVKDNHLIQYLSLFSIIVTLYLLMSLQSWHTTSHLYRLHRNLHSAAGLTRLGHAVHHKMLSEWVRRWQAYAFSRHLHGAAIVVQSLQFSFCCIVFVVQYLLCSPCYIDFAVQSLLCSLCCVVFVVLTLLCIVYIYIYFIQLCSRCYIVMLSFLCSYAVVLYSLCYIVILSLFYSFCCIAIWQ